MNDSLTSEVDSIVQAAEMSHQIAELREMNHMLVMLLAHELGTPLTHILAYLRLLQERAPVIERSDLDLAVEQALTLKGRLEDLLLLDQLEAGLGEVCFVPVSIQEIILRVLDATRAQVHDKGLNLSTHIVCNYPVYGDRELLYRALRQVIENACKFSRPYGKIEVRAESVGDECHVTVADEGIGIPSEKQAQIFDPFYQVDLTRSRRYSGLGIGLKLVRAIIEKHSGSIHVSSQVGHGSTFELTMPLA